MMETCIYCNARATTMDAVGLPTCAAHRDEADEYFEQRTGHSPHEDLHLYCDDHCDLWQPGCPRCEENSQHHYGMSVAEFKRTPAAKVVVFPYNPADLAFHPDEPEE